MSPIIKVLYMISASAWVCDFWPSKIFGAVTVAWNDQTMSVFSSLVTSGGCNQAQFTNEPLCNIVQKTFMHSPCAHDEH